MTKVCEWCGNTFPESLNWKGHWVDTDGMGVQRYYVCSDKCLIESEPNVPHADPDEVTNWKFWEAVIGIVLIFCIFYFDW